MSAEGLRVGHFGLYVRFKASVRAKSLFQTYIVIHNESRTDYHKNIFALRLALKEGPSMVPNCCNIQ